MKSNKKFVGAGIVSAVAASMCCVAPALTLISGATGLASSFSWIEPARPYLIGLSVATLSFAWYTKLRKQKAEEMDCDCETEETQPFMQSKQFLGIVTVLAVVMMAYPLYGDSVYAALAGTTISGSQTLSGQTKTEVYKIKGMTCSSCEEHVKHEVGALSGVVKIEVDYGKGTAAVTYDQDLALTESIIDAINATGYEYIGMKHIGESNE